MRTPDIKYLFFSLLPCLFISCASMPGNDPENPRDQLKAENRMMKRNLNLSLRENEVLKVENAALKAEKDGLKADIASLTAKYHEEIARLNDQYDDLCSRFDALERESDAMISDLIELNADLEKNYSAEISVLKESLKDQADSFKAEQAAAAAEFRSRLSEMDNQLATIQKTLAEKEMERLLLDEARRKSDETAAHLEKTLKEKNDILARKEKENQELLAAMRKLEADIAEKQAVIDALPVGPPPNAAPAPAPTESTISP